ncbi:CRISPR-associated endoribonuclease Cas6 [Clostridium botulinum]|uniref:CRISPR-associated endoribonuclease Cas6 n=1 Tax=Clostridium botulinum TaxID=1491 RepID=UPI00030E3E57|nr:CRISPR-associated endoribonuclease Cas6 [Clostridium botulinum]KLU76887.1 CRISPR-associated protein Cas6 [Clostridium botulinum V891]KOA91003.1 CRISPR-associated protein Cas6 [Clostridium botulinum]MCD3204255.1 CRISPR-associated endoribonuclease Cas6 [Clostridium botulinum C/D]MCD3224019.1 CRISPR-associated endoribonuclease Cas6 [Clostridium botulinum C/D]MCD3231665.1 CRISPR-associated endoribonuclease Cas6 [Clostridium botulinum C/D]
MEIYEEKVKVYLLNDISKEDVIIKNAQIIDKTLCRDEQYSIFHEENKFKLYCFNGFYPLEKSGVYKKGRIYDFNIRTVDKKFAKFIRGNLVNEYTEYIKVLTIQERIIQQRYIEKIYSIMPVILKTPKGYWKRNLQLEDFEKLIKVNLIKKYNQYYGTKIDENFSLYDNLIFDNKKPVPIKCKNITLLGDKITLYISGNEMAQKLAQFALGTSIGENSARGAGYMNYKWL